VLVALYFWQHFIPHVQHVQLNKQQLAAVQLERKLASMHAAE
jgi:hypothetical protein